MDVGTGDGLFVYNCARKEPQKLFIGIDANRRPLQKISERIHRRPAKGGLPNVLFLEAAVEALPYELDGTASEVHVNFPWGSLLRGVAKGDLLILGNLRHMCKADAFLKVLIGIDFERDGSEVDRLGLTDLDTDYIDSVLVKVYRNAGFDLVETENIAPSNQPEFQTSWARRLRMSSHRSFIRIVARAVGQQTANSKQQTVSESRITNSNPSQQVMRRDSRSRMKSSGC